MTTDTSAVPRTVLVTGATGSVGRHLVRYLLDAGITVRALSRNPLLAGLPDEVEVHEGHPGDPASLAAAAHGTDAAFLVWMGGDASGADESLAALAAHVSHVVHLSAAELQEGRSGAKPGVWADVEDAVRRSGVAWTFLRAGGFAANALGWAADVRAGRPVAMPYPDAVRTSVHERDLAEAAWRCLVDSEHRGRSYELTGPAPLTQRQEAELIAAASGQVVTVRHQSRDEAAAELREAWGPEGAEAALDYWSTLVTDPERVGAGVGQLTGHPPRTFAGWAADHADDFRAPGTGEVAARYADAFRTGRIDRATALLAPDVVRVAPLEDGGEEVEVRGLAAIAENAVEQLAGVDLVGVEVSEPMVGPDRFAIRFDFDERLVATGEARRTTKISLCTVEAGRIVREEVFYYTPPTAVAV